MERNEVIISNGNGLQSTKLLTDRMMAVCYIETVIKDPKSGKVRQKRGTGFLSKLSLKDCDEVFGVFTNNHVLGTETEAENTDATFGYEGTNDGEKVKLKPNIMFRTNKELDYTFVGVNKDVISDLKLRIEPILLEPEPDNLKKEESIVIFQHPKGRPKEYSQERIANIEKPFVYYKADTENGSSGSPVLTSVGLKLIAIHHKGSEDLSYNKGTLASEVLMHLEKGTYTKPSSSFSDSQDKEIFEDGPPNKKSKKNKEDNNNSTQPSEEVLENLSQDIVSFWKPLGRLLKVPRAKLEEIQGDNIQYPGIKEKAYQMLSAWADQEETATFSHLSQALKRLGKKTLAKKYCGTS